MARSASRTDGETTVEDGILGGGEWSTEKRERSRARMGRRGASRALTIPEGPGMMLRFVWGLDMGHSPGGGAS